MCFCACERARETTSCASGRVVRTSGVTSPFHFLFFSLYHSKVHAHIHTYIHEEIRKSGVHEPCPIFTSTTQHGPSSMMQSVFIGAVCIFFFRDYIPIIQCHHTNTLHYASLLLTKAQLLGTAITARNASPERDIAQADIQV